MSNFGTGSWTHNALSNILLCLLFHTMGTKAWCEIRGTWNNNKPHHSIVCSTSKREEQGWWQHEASAAAPPPAPVSQCNVLCTAEDVGRHWRATRNETFIEDHQTTNDTGYPIQLRKRCQTASFQRGVFYFIKSVLQLLATDGNSLYHLVMDITFAFVL